MLASSITENKVICASSFYSICANVQNLSGSTTVSPTNNYISHFLFPLWNLKGPERQNFHGSIMLIDAKFVCVSGAAVSLQGTRKESKLSKKHSAGRSTFAHLKCTLDQNSGYKKLISESSKWEFSERQQQSQHQPLGVDY